MTTHDSVEFWLGLFSTVLLLLQLPATAIVLSRLFRGLNRQPRLPLQSPTPDLVGAVSIVLPTLNEAQRITPCLNGLTRQSYEVREIIVVDSHSQDGTQDLVKAMAQSDPRFRLITDDSLPPGWVGRPWALQTGFLTSSPESEWILGIDADTQPDPQLAATVVKAAIAGKYDLVSLSCRFILKYPGELWLQPALLITLIYRFGPPDTQSASPERLMANGQCFLCRRSVLETLGGYEIARSSFCDDVTLARYAASQGFEVGFLDGAEVLKVRMYDGFWDTWNGWGRSLDLKDASSKPQLWCDLWVLAMVQGLPMVVLIIALVLIWQFSPVNPLFWLWVAVNGMLFLTRVGMNWAILPSYDFAQSPGSWAFWLSPLADPLAVVRLLQSAGQRSIQWRGKVYSKA
ncbi:MAG: glycosyltransferase [Oscillatoriales cyanobacterium SM2_3_0]|nr:glycosyltransferase [Oscillatoriales cyanobacterium SM2_3_0]